MIDLVNVQFYGFHVLMYAMILATTGAITFATVYPTQMPSIGPLPSLPSTNPSSATSIPGVANMGGPPAPPQVPPSTPGPQGGKHASKKTKRKRSPKKSHHSAKNVKKNIKIH